MTNEILITTGIKPFVVIPKLKNDVIIIDDYFYQKYTIDKILGYYNELKESDCQILIESFIDDGGGNEYTARYNLLQLIYSSLGIELYPSPSYPLKISGIEDFLIILIK